MYRGLVCCFAVISHGDGRRRAAVIWKTKKLFFSNCFYKAEKENDLQGAGRFFAVKFFADKRQKGCG